MTWAAPAALAIRKGVRAKPRSCGPSPTPKRVRPPTCTRWSVRSLPSGELRRDEVKILVARIAQLMDALAAPEKVGETPRNDKHFTRSPNGGRDRGLLNDAVGYGTDIRAATIGLSAARVEES